MRLSAMFALVGFMLLSTGCERGCNCGGEPPSIAPDGATIPTDVEGLRRAFASRFPLGTHAIFMVAPFTDLSSSVQAIKERIRPIFDLAAVESEIRNTFGVDIHRHVTFREAGLAYDAGFALGLVQQQPVMALFLIDPEAFLERAQLVLRRQPFNLRAPAQSEQVGDFRINLYSRRTNQPPQIAVVTDGLVGFVISRATPASDLAEVARQVASVSVEASVAANPEFDRQLAYFADFPSFLFLDTVVASDFYQERLSDQLEPGEAFALSQFNTSVASIGGGARIEDDRLVFRGYLSVTERVAEQAAGIDAPSGDPPQLARFLSPSTILAVRTGVDPRIVWDTILRFQGERGAPLLRRRVRPFEEFLGATIDQDVSALLTGNMVLMVNRVSILSLLQGNSFADWADALSLVGVAQLTDRQRTIAILDRLTGTDTSPYHRLEEGSLIRYTCRQEEPCFGTLIVGEDLLVLAADRVGRWAMSRLTQQTPTHPGEMQPAAQFLMSKDVATGFFINFTRLVPIATILNYPQAVRDLLGLIDTLVVDLHSAGNGVLIDGQLMLTASEQ